MAAEEFVLIPRSIYIREQPEIGQILETPTVQNKALQISMIQRNPSKQNQQTLNEESVKP